MSTHNLCFHGEVSKIGDSNKYPKHVFLEVLNAIFLCNS